MLSLSQVDIDRKVSLLILLTLRCTRYIFVYIYYVFLLILEWCLTSSSKIQFQFQVSLSHGDELAQSWCHKENSARPSCLLCNTWLHLIGPARMIHCFVPLQLISPVIQAGKFPLWQEKTIRIVFIGWLKETNYYVILEFPDPPQQWVPVSDSHLNSWLTAS